MNNWCPFKSGESIGQRGSEGGIIIRDEEHSRGMRITLEREGQTAPFAITCGIYGWMVHTRFFESETEAQSQFEDMKEELSRITSAAGLDAGSMTDIKSRAVSEAMSDFVKRFP